MLVLESLRYAAAPSPEGAGIGIAAALATTTRGELQWALDAGLGPLIFRATRDTPESVPETLRDLLLSADMTAQVLHGARIDATKELIDACTRMSVPVTLLKGMSISEQCYASPHLRSMTDIDILVPEDAVAAMENEALRQGYRKVSSIMGPNAHHAEPLYHPERQTKVEFHRALFDQDSRLSHGCLFGDRNIADQSISRSFHGREVRRLSDELQLVYIASYWTQDLTQQSIHPSFLPPMLDAVSLLRAASRTFDWNRLVSMLDNDFATASLCILLNCLTRHDLIEGPPVIIDELRRRQDIVAAPELRIIEALVSGYLIRGRPFAAFNSWHLWRNLLEAGSSHAAKVLLLPWHVAFPPSYPTRFDPRAQTARLARFIRRRL